MVAGFQVAAATIRTCLYVYASVLLVFFVVWYCSVPAEYALYTRSHVILCPHDFRYFSWKRTKLILFFDIPCRGMGQCVFKRNRLYRVNCVAWFVDFQWICLLFREHKTLCDFLHEANGAQAVHAKTSWTRNVVYCVPTNFALNNARAECGVWEKERGREPTRNGQAVKASTKSERLMLYGWF